VAAAITLHAEWGLLFGDGRYQPDALFQEAWMRRYADPSLFTDSLTADLRSSGYFPAGLELFHRAVAHLADPVSAGAWMAVVLAPLSAWLLFRCIRLHTPWAPAAWLGSLLLLMPVDILRFSGGHSRAFAQPVILATLLLALSARHRLAALVPPAGMLLYPPAALGALAMICLSALRRHPDRERLALAGGSAAASVALGLLLGSDNLISKSDAERYPEFGAEGQFPIFGHTLRETLAQNYTGFNLLLGGSILAVAAIAVIVLSPSVIRRVRPEVWALAAGSLLLFALAHAALFRLYLPNRYTYPLLPVFCIVIAVGWEPLWERAARRRAWPALSAGIPAAILVVAWWLFPLGNLQALSGLVDWLRDSALLLVPLPAAAVLVLAALRPRAAVWAAVIAGTLLISAVGVAGGGTSAEYACPQTPLMRELSSFPPDAVIAGDPFQMNCVPIAARRPVVISQKLYQPLAEPYFVQIRPRMLDMVRAYWGPDLAALATLRARYGARYLVVDRHLPHIPPGWGHEEPFTGMIAGFLRNPAGSAVQRLGDRCLVWRRGATRIYDLTCLTAA
jgi:hypothetical protein